MQSCSPLQLLQWPLIVLISVVLLILSVYYRRLGWRLYTVLGLFGAVACMVLTYAFYRLALLGHELDSQLTTIESAFPPVSEECFETSLGLSALPFAILAVTYIYQFLRRRRRKSRAL